MTQDQLEFACDNCGGLDFKGITPQPKPDDVITCAGCGRANTYDVLHKSRMEQGQKYVGDLIGEAFKGVRGFKFTPKG